MGHSISFADQRGNTLYHGAILNEGEIMDIVELFYRWGDAKFRLLTNEKEKKFRGQHHMGWDGVHEITLCEKNIKRDFDRKHRVGGNFAAPTLKCAAAMVLVHELQHANQTKLHKHQSSFYGNMGGETANGRTRMKHYWGRACEREAREYVDNNMAEICAYFQAPWQGGRTTTMVSTKESIGEAQAVAELLQECPQVTLEDVKDELRASKILNPANVRLVIDFLKKNGKDIF